jgi:hypothetical protein
MELEFDFLAAPLRRNETTGHFNCPLGDCHNKDSSKFRVCSLTIFVFQEFIILIQTHVNKCFRDPKKKDAWNKFCETQQAGAVLL